MNANFRKTSVTLAAILTASILWGCDNDRPASCVDTGSCAELCGNGAIDADASEFCDGANLNGATCASVMGSQYTGTLKCHSDCQGFDTSECVDSSSASNLCGNGAIDGDEKCDGENHNGATCASVVGEGSTGTLKCMTNCTGFNTAECTPVDISKTCGNGTIDGDEKCDGSNYNGATCASVAGEGYLGELACSADCKALVTTGCYSLKETCGNGSLDEHELCDGEDLNGETCSTILGGDYVGTLACKPNCADYNTKGCIPRDQTVSIRVLTVNLNSGNISSDDGNGANIIKALKPDIILAQEFKYKNNSDSAIKEYINNRFGSEYAYYCIGNEMSNSSVPNGIISRYPIKADENNHCYHWYSQLASSAEWSWGILTIPGSKELIVASVNLDEEKYSTELPDLKSKFMEKFNSGSYFAGIIGGTFNTPDRTLVESIFDQVLDVGGKYPADQEGNDNTDLGRTIPANWLLATHELISSPMEIGTSVYNNGIVFDSRVYTPLSDLPSVSSGDSVAGMQYMVVGRDLSYICKGCK